MSRSLHTFFLSLVLLSTLSATLGFTPLYSAATQCGSFTVTWGASNITTGPPFLLFLLPFDAQPAILKLPDSSYDSAQKTGKYTLDKLPLNAGAQFVLSMDDGYGLSTGGVSLIQTVASSSDASCLPADVPSMSSFFTLDPATPSQCSTQTVSWNSTRYPQPPIIRGFIPGGQGFTLDHPTSNSTTQQTWDVHVREGTQMVFLVYPSTSNPNESNARTSQLITVTGKSSRGDTCLSAGSPSSTVLLASTASSTASPTVPVTPTASDLSGNVKVAAIAGGVIGGLGLIAILCASFALYRSFTRTVEPNPPKKPGPGGSSQGTNSQQRSRPFASSNNGIISTTGDRSLAGITIASTQVSRGPHMALGSSRGIAPAPSMHKPPLNVPEWTEHRHIVVPVDPSPIVSSIDDALSDRWQDPSAPGMDDDDEKERERADTFGGAGPRAQDEPERDPAPRREHAWRAHPYANPLAAVNPAPVRPRPRPLPPRRSAQSPSPAPLPLRSVRRRGDNDNGAGDDDGGADADADADVDVDGDQAVSEEYAFESRRGLSMRSRMDRAGNVYGSGGIQSQEDELETEYVRHTDAGVIKVVELPPLYNDVQR